MLAPAAGARLTDVALAGKTAGVPRSEHGMTTHATTTDGSARPCPGSGPPVDVVQWRACRLREAGFPPALALRLARQRVDLHALLQLVDRGCPPELAARILAPDDPLEVGW
jgi:hypothetical protein